VFFMSSTFFQDNNGRGMSSERHLCDRRGLETLRQVEAELQVSFGRGGVVWC
jgi:hypothetical protein